jgi:polysaccharide biosynthesis transport protein
MIEHNFKTHFAARQQLVHWLSGQMDDLRTRVQTSQDRMIALEHKLGLLALDPQHSLVISEISNLEKMAAESTEQRVVAEARFKILSTMPPDQIVDSSTPLGSDFPNNSLGTLRSQRSVAAAELAKLTPVYGPNYPAVRQARSQLESLEASIAAQQNRVVQQAREAYELAQRDETKARGILDAKTSAIYTKRDDLAQYELVSEESSSSRHLYQSILQRLQEATVNAGLDAADIEIVDLAAIPVVPSSTSPLALGGIGLGFGFLAMLALALFRDRTDMRLRESIEIQQCTGLPALSVIPRLKLSRADTSHSPYLQTGVPELLQAPQSGFSESFRALRTTIHPFSKSTNGQVLAVTSCRPREGKTTVSINMAAALAQSGKRVLLVDADLRRPALRERLHIPVEHGLSEVLAGYADAGKFIQELPHLPTFHVLVSGATPPLPADLLSSDQMSRFIAQSRREYDYIILDTPPVLSVSDARVVAAECDGVVFTVRSGYCTSNMLTEAIQAFDSVRARKLGFVLNRTDSGAKSYYGYYGRDERSAA